MVSKAHPRKSQSRQKRIRVFYIDDKIKDRERMREACARAPERDLIYAEDEGKDSVHLLDKIEQFGADVVIVDLLLAPIGFDTDQLGLRTVDNIRQKFGPSLPIVVYTNWTVFSTQARQAGASLVLPKTISTDVLRKAIRDQAVKSKESKTTEDGMEAIRIFHVEDAEMMRGTIQRMCELTPEGDLIYAGWDAANSPDLPERVAAVNANVALVDLLLTNERQDVKEILRTPPKSGIEAVSSLHRKFGDRLIIIVLTNYPEYTPLALEAGANTVLDKSISYDELRREIRDLVAGKEPVPFGIGEPRSLDIIAGTDERCFVVRGEHGRTPELRVQPLPMSFLVYLAEEQKAGKADFIKTHRARHGAGENDSLGINREADRISSRTGPYRSVARSRAMGSAD